MTTKESSPVYTVYVDAAATPAQTTEIRHLFDEIGLDTTVTSNFTVKSPVVVVVMYLVGSGVAAAWLRAAAKFGENVGGELGSYVGESIKNWLERARKARNQEFAIVIQDPSLTAEIVVTGYEPAEALEQLISLIENNQIGEIPGQSTEVRYRDGEGWIRHDAIPVERYVCPNGDFVWVRPNIAATIPTCPSHCLSLLRMDQ
jgi:hypothetical protein